jgi:glutamine amidotransferase
LLTKKKIKKKITIIDYGMGNILSIQNAINFLGYKSILSNEPKLIEKSDILILPGVGSFNQAMKRLNKLKLVEAIKKNIFHNNGKILGICLGMQLLAKRGSENGKIKGIGLINGSVLSLKSKTNKVLPHIGFNKIVNKSNSKLFNGIKKDKHFYFVHSYYFEPKSKNLNFKYSYCNYGKKFISSFESDKICGTQFHPEKSQKNGLTLLNNFFNLVC